MYITSVYKGNNLINYELNLLSHARYVATYIFFLTPITIYHMLLDLVGLVCSRPPSLNNFLDSPLIFLLLLKYVVAEQDCKHQDLEFFDSAKSSSPHHSLDTLLKIDHHPFSNIFQLVSCGRPLSRIVLSTSFPSPCCSLIARLLFCFSFSVVVFFLPISPRHATSTAATFHRDEKFCKEEIAMQLHSNDLSTTFEFGMLMNEQLFSQRCVLQK